VISARFCSSNSDSCSAPQATSFLICGALSAVIQATPSDWRMSSRLALVTIPRSATTITIFRAKRVLSLEIWAGSVLSSCSSPVNTSIAIGRPGRSQSSP
jgi:hypothetical protein